MFAVLTEQSRVRVSDLKFPTRETSFHLTRLRTRIAVALLLAGAAGASTLVRAEIIEVEGPLQAVTDIVVGNDTILCNGVLIEVPDGTPITSPTANLAFSELDDAPAFTNSGKGNGFLGGTCAVSGNNDDGPNVADAVFVEVAENVLVGTVTNPSNSPAIMGVPIWFISDSRMPFTGAVNDFGFAINENSLVAGDLASAEGYLGTDNVLYVHTLEAASGTLLQDPGSVKQVSIQLATCRDRGATIDIEVRGGITIPNTLAPRQVRAFRVIPATGGRGALLGSAGNLVADLEFPTFGSYRIRATPAQSTCPARIEVEYRRSGAVPAVYAVVRADMTAI